MRIRLSPFIVYLCLFLGCHERPAEASSTCFDMKRGVNIGNWLAFSKYRGEQREKIFTISDIDKLASYGFDHLRLPVDEEQMFTEKGDIDKNTIKLVHQTISQCKKNKMRVIFDLHVISSHYYNSDNNILWTSRDAKLQLVQMWKKLMGELEQYPETLVAYELLNEPVAPYDEQWNEVVKLLIKTVRQVNKKRVIVVDANKWATPILIDKLWVPKNDRNIILSFHFYEPMLLTHYGAKWHRTFSKLKADVKLRYPGLLFSDDVFLKMSKEDQRIVKPYFKEYDKEYIRSRWLAAIKFAKKNKLRLYLGEFGCLPNAGEKLRLAWLRDVVSLCKEYGIPYSLWEYNNVFGFAERGTGMIKNPEMLRILTE